MIKKISLLVIMAIGICLLYGGYYTFKQSRDALNWPQTKGQMISSSLTIDHLPKFINSRIIPNRWYGIQVEYEYTVGEGRYSSHRLSFQKGDTRYPKEALAALNKYRSQQEITVYYNPQDRTQAVLEPGAIGDIYFLLILGGFLTFFSLLTLYYQSLEYHCGADSFINQGQAYQNQGKFEEAFVEYTRAIRMNPRFALGYSSRGELYLQQKETLAKMKFFVVGPDGTTILNELIKSGILEEVSPIEVRLKPDIELKQDTVREIAKGDFDEIWAILQQFQKNWDKAIADFNQAIVLDPKNASVYFYLANAYLGKKEYPQAWVNMNKAMDRGFKISLEILKNIEKRGFKRAS